MGLDMYLYDSEMDCELKYWRKANAIHRWFIENCADGVDDCSPIEVTAEDIERLVTVCKDVVKHCAVIPTTEDGDISICNVEYANNLLPTGGGFFFGSTEYDDYYISQIQRTAEVLEDILLNRDEEDTYIYQASW